MLLSIFMIENVTRFAKELRSCVEHRATLNRHERGIGAVRFAPRKQGMQDLLATAADDSYIIIWKYVPGEYFSMPDHYKI